MSQKRISAESPAPLTRISYWLMPVAEDSDRLDELIGRLAEGFAGPIFAPHLTVYSGPAADSDDPVLILERALGPGGEIVLGCTGLSFSDKFTKTCFLTFASTPRLSRLSEAIRQNLGHPEKYDLKPHLSLLYAKLSGSERQGIREMVELPEAVRFDSLVAMATSARINSAEDVMSWRILASHKL